MIIGVVVRGALVQLIVGSFTDDQLPNSKRLELTRPYPMEPKRLAFDVQSWKPKAQILWLTARAPYHTLLHFGRPSPYWTSLPLFEASVN